MTAQQHSNERRAWLHAVSRLQGHTATRELSTILDHCDHTQVAMTDGHPPLLRVPFPEERWRTAFRGALNNPDARRAFLNVLGDVFGQAPKIQLATIKPDSIKTKTSVLPPSLLLHTALSLGGKIVAVTEANETPPMGRD